MKLSEIYSVVDRYYQFRGLTYPNLFDASYWLCTEVGELQNAITRLESGWVRNNNENNPMEKVSDELGDVLMMFVVTAHLAGYDKELTYEPFNLDQPSDLKYNACILAGTVNELSVGLYEGSIDSFQFGHVLERIEELAGYLQINPYQAMLKKFFKKGFIVNV